MDLLSNEEPGNKISSVPHAGLEGGCNTQTYGWVIPSRAKCFVCSSFLPKSQKIKQGISHFHDTILPVGATPCLSEGSNIFFQARSAYAVEEKSDNCLLCVLLGLGVKQERSSHLLCVLLGLGVKQEKSYIYVGRLSFLATK